jgi:hypothetical protein
VLAQYAPAEETGAYLLAINGIAVLMMLTSAPLQSSLHRMSEFFALSQTTAHVEVAQRVRNQSLWITALMTGLVALAIPLLGSFAVHRAFVSLRVWSELSAALLIQRYAAAHLHHYTITNHVIWHWLDGVTGVVNILLCLVLIPQLHGEGAALASLLSLLPFYCWIPTVLAVRRFTMPWPYVDRGVVGPVAMQIALFVLAAAIGSGLSAAAA